MLAGGCGCGFARYEADGPIRNESLCHCTDCRRAAGAPAVAWFTVARGGLRWTAGEPTRYRSSAMATRGFCPRCGTQLTYEHDELPDTVDVTTGSLDDPEVLPPEDHTWASQRVSWLRLSDDLPRFEAARPSE